MKIVTSIVLGGLCLAVTACSGGGLVRGEPPLVGISSLYLQQNALRTAVNIYNPNDVEMPVDVIEMSMTLGETDLGKHSTRLDITIHPKGTEEVSVDFPAGDSAPEALGNLERGDVNSVSYEVNGQIRDASGGSERFSQRGHFYPVPGRPGQFRGAGPQRERLRDP